MRHLILCLLLFLLSAVNISAQSDTLLHTTYAKRYNYVSILKDWAYENEDQASAVDSVEQVISKVRRAGDDALAYELTFMLISIDAYMKKQGRLQEVTKQIDKAAKEGHIYEATYGKTRLAIYFWNSGKKIRATELALSAYNIYKDFPVTEFPERVPAQTRLATWYFYYEDYLHAKKLLLELQSATSGNMAEEFQWPANILALTYRELKQYDSALYYFTKVYYYNGEAPDERKKALAAGNIGSIYLFTEDPDLAILWLKRELYEWKQINNNSSLPSASAYSYAADAYLKKGDLSSATTYIDSASALLRKVRKSFVEYQRFYLVKARVLTEQRNYIEALKYKDSVTMMVDSIYHIRNRAQLLDAEKRVEEARHEKEVEYLESLRRNSIWIRNFAIAAILLLAVILLLLINRSRIKHKEKELQALSEKSSAENKLLQFTRQIQSQNSQIEELKEELQHMTDEHDMTVKHESIARLQQSTILTDEQWDDFRNMFEDVYSGFIARVKEKFASLTPAELRYLTLLKLGLSNKEMANMLGVNTNTIHNYKSRLRRKYSIADTVQLEELVNEI